MVFTHLPKIRKFWLEIDLLMSGYFYANKTLVVLRVFYFGGEWRAGKSFEWNAVLAENGRTLKLENAFSI